LPGVTKFQMEHPPGVRIRGWEFPAWPWIFLFFFGTSLLFLRFGPYVYSAPPGYIDPWIYTGIFTHFRYVFDHYSYTYYASRLPWDLPAALIYQIASPDAASLILKSLVLAVSASALYHMVMWHYGKLPATLATIALLTNPYFLTSVCWDYPDGPSIAYALLAAAAFLRPSRGRVPNGVLGGAGLALSGYTNLAALPVLIGIAAIPLWRNKASIRALARQAWQVFLGGTAVTLVFAIAGRILVRRLLFFQAQIDQILYTRTHPDYLANMWGRGYAWIPVAFRLFPPLLLLFLGAVLWLRRRLPRPAYIETYLCLLVTCILYCIFEFGLHNVGLRVHYHSSYMVTVLFAFEGMLIGEYLSSVRDTEGARSRAAAAWVIVAVFGASLPFIWENRVPFHLSNAEFWWSMLLLALATAALMAAFSRPGLAARAVWCCLVFVGMFFGPAYDGKLAYVWSKENATTFDVLLRLERAIDSSLDPQRTARLWFEKDEPDRPAPGGGSLKPFNLFTSEYAMYIGGYFDFTKALRSDAAKGLASQMDKQTTLIHVSFTEDPTPERDELLRSRGVVTGNERRRDVPTEFGTVHIVLQDVIDDSNFH